MKHRAVISVLAALAIMLCACSAPQTVEPSDANDSAFEEAAPGERYDIVGRMAAWYASVGLTRRDMDKSEYGYIYDGKSEAESAYLDSFSFTRFSNGDMVGVAWTGEEHPENDEELRTDMAEEMARHEQKEYLIEGDGKIYWLIIISDEPDTAQAYYQSSVNGEPPAP